MKYLIAPLLIITSFALAADDRERTVCGVVKERAYFTLWSSQAPERNASRITAHPHIEEVAFTTGDDRVLRGYRFQAHDEDQQEVEADSYMLIAMGNAMVSDQVIPYLERYARAGINAYVYDYRGYADSEGRRRIQAIVKDYEEIITDLSKNYQQGYLYGTSLGGLVLLNVLKAQPSFTRAVIDSSPSRLSDFGCPEWLDPVHHIASDTAGKLLIITGARDRVLNQGMTAPLRQKAEEMGAYTHHGAEFDHPFMDGVNAHHQRQQLVMDFLIRGEVP
ncbi:MAG: alpha/beta hydrolase [Idiomarina sp.]|nr:alpha/beta hydrolase [Idiomarina sp.]